LSSNFQDFTEVYFFDIIYIMYSISDLEKIKAANTKAAENAIAKNPELAGGETTEEQGRRNAEAVELMAKRLAELKAKMPVREGNREIKSSRKTKEKKLSPMSTKMR
jgi:hypothetical protein